MTHAFLSLLLRRNDKKALHKSLNQFKEIRATNDK